MLTMPSGGQAKQGEEMLIMLLIYSGVTMLTGWLISRELRRERTHASEAGQAPGRLKAPEARGEVPSAEALRP